MDSESLLTFVTIHQANSFSAAADILGRSQPAISRRIALLEEQLGVPVFERAAGGVTLSEAGRTLLPHAERVLAALRGEVTLGLRYLLDPSADLVCEHIASEAMVIVCPPEHRFAGRKIDTLAKLRDEPWFAFPNAFEQRETFADNIFAQFQARGIGTIRWTPLDSLTAKKRLIEAGLGLALLPESAIDDELRAGSLATIPVADFNAANPIHAVVRKGGYLSPATQNLLSLLRSQSGFAARSTPRNRKSR